MMFQTFHYTQTDWKGFPLKVDEMNTNLDYDYENVPTSIVQKKIARP